MRNQQTDVKSIYLLCFPPQKKKQKKSDRLSVLLTAHSLDNPTADYILAISTRLLRLFDELVMYLRLFLLLFLLCFYSHLIEHTNKRQPLLENIICGGCVYHICVCIYVCVCMYACICNSYANKQFDCAFCFCFFSNFFGALYRYL